MPNESNLQSQNSLVQKLKWLNGVVQMLKHLQHVKLGLEQNIQDQREPTLQHLRQIAEKKNALAKELYQLEDEAEQLDSYRATIDWENRCQEHKEQKLLMAQQENSLESEDDDQVVDVDSAELSNADSDDGSSFFLILGYDQRVVDALLARTPQQVQAQAQRLAELPLKLAELSAQQSTLQSQVDVLLAQQQQLAALTRQLNEGQQEKERLELELFEDWKREVLAPQMEEMPLQALELPQRDDAVGVIGVSAEIAHFEWA